MVELEEKWIQMQNHYIFSPVYRNDWNSKIQYTINILWPILVINSMNFRFISVCSLDEIFNILEYRKKQIGLLYVPFTP